MRTREWATVDYYAELGVDPGATADEITAAFRARARDLHPDARPADPTAAERFTAMTIAYGVLGGPDRAEYDEFRLARSRVGSGPLVAAPLPPPGPPRRFQLTRRGAFWAFGGGVALLVGGLAIVGVLLSLHARTSRLHADGIPATAVVVADHGDRRLEFPTRSGRIVRVDAPDTKSADRPAVGTTMQIRYDRHDPTHVLTPTDTTARDITLGIVAAKFLIVGGFLVVVGVRFLFATEPFVGATALA